MIIGEEKRLANDRILCDDMGAPIHLGNTAVFCGHCCTWKFPATLGSCGGEGEQKRAMVNHFHYTTEKTLGM